MALAAYATTALLVGINELDAVPGRRCMTATATVIFADRSDACRKSTVPLPILVPAGCGVAVTNIAMVSSWR